MGRSVSIWISKSHVPGCRYEPARSRNYSHLFLSTTVLIGWILSSNIFILPIHFPILQTSAPHKSRDVQVFARLILVHLAKNIDLWDELGHGDGYRLGGHFEL